jgi:malonate-semialdehyde dehydrogenase (acetylating)/methylmalonate-semialdehyde dehydrogenase
MTYRVTHYIDGQSFSDPNESVKKITNPGTGACIGEVLIAARNTCTQAVASAQKAWPAWANTTPSKRIQILFQFRNLLAEHSAKLANLVCQEHGKTLEDAKGSIARGIELIEFHCGLLSQIQGRFSANVSQQIDCYSFRQPLGVCAGISPFNFPVMVPIWMMIPAIACGNTFILKPSEQDPSASVYLLDLLHKAGLPPGVVNVVQGDANTVDYLLSEPDIQAFTAVASSAVAESIYKRAVTAGKRAHTFGGAKNHAVILPDADFSQVAKALSGAAYGSAGERCMAISVIVTVGDHTAEQFLQAFLPEIKKIQIGIGTDAHTDMGPVISQIHRQRIIHAINQGVAEGAQLVIDGRDYIDAKEPNGFYLGPCLFDHVTEDMSIYQNEIFGPVLVMLRVPNLDAAIALVNRNQYGNGTAIFTQDGYSGRHYSHTVQIGMVGVNIPIPVPIASHPFGGWKRSAFGDIAMHGEESIHFYTKSKTITTKWLTLQHDTSSFVMPKNG